MLLLLSHSKDLSQMLVHLVSALVRIPLLNLFMQEFINNEPKQIVVCSPLQANSLTKSFKDRVCQVAIVEADYLFWFGYGEGLKLLASSLPSKVSYKLSCI